MSLIHKTIQFFHKLKNFIFSLGSLAQLAKNGLKSGRKQTELDKKLVFSLAKSRWPSFRQLKYIKKYLNQVERLVVAGCLLIIFASLSFLAVRFYKTHLQEVAVDGGDYIEGVVGAVKYINPLYSTVSDIDSDLAGLIYSSLFRRGENTELVNDLADGYEVSPDGKIYTIKIKPNIAWHNGGPLTVDDIVFTFSAIKNPRYNSPLRASFIGVEIEKIDDNTIKFSLVEPYAAFLELLNFGILPRELWEQIDPAAASLAELNLKPIGSGRYKFKSLAKDKSGNIRNYTLVRNDNYYNQPAHINTISFKLFVNFQELISALNNNLIDGISYLPEQEKNQVVAQDSLNFHRLNMPKLSAVFFNTKINPALADKKVRQALAYAIDKNQIISQILGGNAFPIDGPILPASFAYFSDVKKYNYDEAAAVKLLDEAGWKIAELNEEDINQANEELASENETLKKQAADKVDVGIGKWLIKDNNYLMLELTTVDNQEYSQVVELIATFWQKLNVKIKINLVPANQIQNDIIKPRNFAALFYSEIIGADPDPYAFWHSSQIGLTGLNIADYANKEVDKLLEEGRLTNDINSRREKYKKFQEIISEDEPAIFLYSPSYTYLQSKNIKGFNVKSIISPSDRFADVDQWYIKTGKKIVW